MNKLESHPSLQATQDRGQSGQFIPGQNQGRAGRLGSDAGYWARACVAEPKSIHVGQVQGRARRVPGAYFTV